MIRPLQIYLAERIQLEGISIGHTYEGLKYLIDHYTHCMNQATAKQMDDRARQHCTSMLIDMKLHVKLYENAYPELVEQPKPPG